MQKAPFQKEEEILMGCTTMVKYGLKQSQENIGKIKLRIIQTDSINLNLIWGQDYE